MNANYQTSGKRTLLIVDDEEDLLEVLEHHLKGLGIDIVRANNGTQALEILRSQKINAVLCDIKMPDKDGIELLSEVRAHAMETPFVFLTGFGSKEHMLEALRLGATDFLEKPFPKEQLVDVVARAVEIGAKKEEIDGKLKKLSNQNAAAYADVEDLDKKKKQVSLLRVVNNAKQKKHE